MQQLKSKQFLVFLNFIFLTQQKYNKCEDLNIYLECEYLILDANNQQQSLAQTEPICLALVDQQQQKQKHEFDKHELFNKTKTKIRIGYIKKKFEIGLKTSLLELISS